MLADLGTVSYSHHQTQEHSIAAVALTQGPMYMSVNKTLPCHESLQAGVPDCDLQTLYTPAGAVARSSLQLRSTVNASYPATQAPLWLLKMSHANYLCNLMWLIVTGRHHSGLLKAGIGTSSAATPKQLLPCSHTLVSCAEEEEEVSLFPLLHQPDVPCVWWTSWRPPDGCLQEISCRNAKIFTASSFTHPCVMYR